MARKVLLETTYTFNASAKTVTIPRAIPRERLILITNVTTNQVIYNFSDPNLRATSYTVSGTPNANLTTIVLNYNTASMSNTDKLQFTYDEAGETFTPSEAYTDPVNKFRTSSPQALIDTDFEYGTQITKWENLGLVNNRPFVFQNPTTIPNITGINLPQNSNVVTVTTSSNHGLTVGTAISVQDTFLSIANGQFIITSVPTGTTFTYVAKATNPSGTLNAIFDSNKTALYTGTIYTGAAIEDAVPTAPVYGWTSGTALPITTSVPHGLAIGNTVAVVGSSQTNANGVWVVARINSNTQFTVYTNTAPAANPTGGKIYVVPQGQVLHRPFDGGVIFTTNAVGNYETLVRQTRRYFRYQSGKGIQISSGTILKPALQIDSMTSSGTTVTVTTKEQHNILPGTSILVSGANESAYNGTFTSVSITGYNTFTYTALSTPSASLASGNIYVSVNGWYGAVNRLGAFDFQNGLFFEFDGQTLYAVRRNSTFQLAGRITATLGSSTVTQTSATFPTYFTKQLNIGDFIVIRGMQYRIADIASDTSLTITPAFRGSTSTNVIASKTIDTKIPQSQWNIDKCDGTGPSGYNIDLSKMQMFYIDYSWYGAGFIRWGFRGVDGNVFYVHKLANNNVNQEAYMRSGNLPARYESQTQPPYTYLTATLNSSDTTLNVNSTAGFPTSGTVLVRNSSSYEYMNYTGITSTSFTGLTRAQAGGTPTITTSLGGNVVVVSSATGIQIGQRVISANVPPGAYVTAISGTSITLTAAATATASGTASTFVPMGTSTSGATFSYNATDPIAVEFAFPTYSPTISHWGTSAIMDGRFDDDKSLVFTFGQSTSTTIAAAASRALFSIRVAPSVDNGIGAAFGARDLVNRMQLTLRSLDISAIPASGNANLLVQAYLNGVPSTATAWTNAVGGSTTQQNSSLAQIASYAGGSTTVSGGEVTAGFFVGSGAQSIDLSQVRDLGNSILGGGGANANTQIYPDGPDTLTIVVTNLAAQSCSVFGRLSWTEAQA
jgi:hypothetical protein